MKKFAFRLQTMLDLALTREEEELRRLGVVRQEQAVQEAVMTRTRAARGDLLAYLTGMQQQAFQPHEMHQGHLRLDAYANDLVAQNTALDAIKERVARQQDVLLEAMRKRKTLEKLREKQYEAYRKESERQELAAMEDTVLPRLARTQAAEQARLRQLTQPAETAKPIRELV